MISRNELPSLKAKLLNYCSENDLFQDYNIEDTFDIIAERFITMDLVMYSKEVNKALHKRKFQKFKNMAYNNKVIKDLEDIQEYYELLRHYEFLSFISYYLRDAFDYKWITFEVDSIFPEYLYNNLQQVLIRSVERYKKVAKRKEILSKTGKVIGTIAFSPLLILAALAKYSFEESEAEKKQKRYYCKYCGVSATEPSKLLHEFCVERTRLNKYINFDNTPLYHQIYEGSDKTEYMCKHCGKTSKSFRDLVTNICHVRYRMNRDVKDTLERATLSHCEPLL